MAKLIAFLDRTAVFALGIIVGVFMGLAFAQHGKLFAFLENDAAQSPAAASPHISPAQAQCVPENFPNAPRVQAALSAKRPLVLGFIGDSFGNGLWTGAHRYFQGEDAFELVDMAKDSTGFTRYSSLNLYDDVAGKIAAKPIDIAVIDFGANDTQGLLVEGKVAPYMSALWQQTMGARVSALVHMLQEKGVAIAWVGLPRMREARYDKDVQAMNDFYAGLMCTLGVVYTNPVRVSEDAEHHFSIDLKDPDEGAPYIARAQDGIHMSVHGYDVIARPIFARIKSLVAKPVPPKPVKTP